MVYLNYLQVFHYKKLYLVITQLCASLPPMIFSESQDRFSENAVTEWKRINAFKVLDTYFQKKCQFIWELLTNLQGGLCPRVAVCVSVRATVAPRRDRWHRGRASRFVGRKWAGEGHGDTWSGALAGQVLQPGDLPRGSLGTNPDASVCRALWCSCLGNVWGGQHRER